MLAFLEAEVRHEPAVHVARLGVEGADAGAMPVEESVTVLLLRRELAAATLRDVRWRRVVASMNALFFGSLNPHGRLKVSRRSGVPRSIVCTELFCRGYDTYSSSSSFYV